MDALELKKSLRRDFVSRRKALSCDERRNADRCIIDRLFALPEFVQAEKIGSFIAFGAEPDLSPVSGKRIFLPRYDENKCEYVMVEVHSPETDLVKGRYGILEPAQSLPSATAEDLQEMFFLVPAVACDRQGMRLGRGGGFYDRLLAGTVRSAAVIYSCQLSEKSLPAEEFDRPVGFVVTECETIVTQSR